jgi:hypothetical protein
MPAAYQFAVGSGGGLESRRPPEGPRIAPVRTRFHPDLPGFFGLRMRQSRRDEQPAQPAAAGVGMHEHGVDRPTARLLAASGVDERYKPCRVFRPIARDRPGHPGRDRSRVATVRPDRLVRRQTCSNICEARNQASGGGNETSGWRCSPAGRGQTGNGSPIAGPGAGHDAPVPSVTDDRRKLAADELNHLHSIAAPRNNGLSRPHSFGCHTNAS